MDADRLRALVEAGRSLVSELDPDEVLQRLLDVARDLTGAAYAAIGVLDDDRRELERFLTAGAGPDVRAAVGELPRGRGVLGVLIDDPRPLRLRDVGEHPRSFGFPAGHPPMRTFLGTPILIGGQPWGNLYLTEKPTDFTQEDEDAAVILADWAAVAIHNARAYAGEAKRRAELERANLALETTAEVGRALGGITDVSHALELVVKRVRALVEARVATLAVLEGDEMVIVAATGEGAAALRGTRLAVEDSLAAAVLAAGRAQRFDGVPSGSFAHGLLEARHAIAAPMTFRSRSVGFLVVHDRLDGGGAFTDDDVRLVEAFAASAATAVVTAQSATDEALRRSIAASEAERARWARELHDETLQELAALRVLLSTARRSEDPQRWRTSLEDAVEMLGGGIHNLRSLITDLRPAALDELGVHAALEALAARTAQQSAVAVELDVALAARLPAEVEATVYRFVQEALTNIVKHADARRATVRVTEAAELTVEVSDDGAGFDPSGVAHGFGILGMQERLSLLGGSLDVASDPGGGTTVSARIPLARAG